MQCRFRARFALVATNHGSCDASPKPSLRVRKPKRLQLVALKAADEFEVIRIVKGGTRCAELSGLSATASAKTRYRVAYCNEEAGPVRDRLGAVTDVG